jgi:hypothetical protein
MMLRYFYLSEHIVQPERKYKTSGNRSDGGAALR